ncbi:MAG: hypothetical protein NFCOHLIN_00834 [Gammaproteobacteria bacterium]|nr:hypothetical protein [Gammaproteobacteria bacterium]
MIRTSKIFPLAALAALAGCATIPEGPSVAVMPGTTKSFEQFREDDAVCRMYADQSIGKSAQASASDSAISSAAVGTALGAAAGALIGAATGDPGAGAAIGAGGGLIVGSAYGYDTYGRSGTTVQDRYDIAYMQCMYAKGNQVPMSGYGNYELPQAPESTYTPPPPPAGSPPPPPAGSPPPPPPGAPQ